MSSPSLKVNIITTLVVLLAVSMIFINIVMLFIYKNDCIQQEIKKIDTLVFFLETHLKDSPQRGHMTVDPQFNALLKAYIAEIGNPPMVVLNERGLRIFDNSRTKGLSHRLERMAHGALASSKRSKVKIGIGWGLFSEQYEYLALSIPLIQNQQLAGALGIAIDYEKVYLRLIESQRVVYFYIAINTLLLALIGFYKINTVTLKPIRKLVNQAEAYKDNSEHFGFFFKKEQNEFGRLSKALNQMLNQISKDKIALRHSVKSLEQLNVELENAQEDIIRAEKLASAGRLSAGIAHEIGNPISIVLGYLELLKTPGLGEQEHTDFVTRAETEINRIDTIIKQLLNFSRPVEEKTQTISIHEILKETTLIFKDQPMMSQIDLNLQLTAAVDWVNADANRLRQVFLNLMLNAADAITEATDIAQGRLEIISKNIEDRNHHPMVQIRFIDNGMGIPPNCMDNIFDPFYTTKDPGKGTGLGLSVSYMIIDQMDGTILAESQEGQGTQISIILPTSNASDTHKME